MPHLPENARLWKERAEIDYIGPFVKAWAAFNAWFRDASGSRRDFEGLRYAKSQLNPVRSRIKPLLRARQLDEHGQPISDTEQALQFKQLVRNLHVCLDNYHLEIERDDVIERISFRSVCLSSGVNLPKERLYNRHRYRATKEDGTWKSTVTQINNGVEKARIEQDAFSSAALQADPAFGQLSAPQRAQLLNLYRECDPRPFTDLLAGGNDPIIAGDIQFRCTDDELFAGLIEIIYAMRNALLHGELQPHEQAFETYEPAYRIVYKFLDCLA